MGQGEKINDSVLFVCFVVASHWQYLVLTLHRDPSSKFSGSYGIPGIKTEQACTAKQVVWLRPPIFFFNISFANSPSIGSQCPGSLPVIFHQPDNSLKYQDARIQYHSGPVMPRATRATQHCMGASYDACDAAD